MNRVTKGELISLVIELSEIIGIPCCKTAAEREGWGHYLYLDYKRAEGGYRLNIQCIDGRGCTGVFGESAACERRSASEMKGYLQGLINGASHRKVKA